MFWAINLMISVATLKVYNLFKKFNLLKIGALPRETYAIFFYFSQFSTCVQYSVFRLHVCASPGAMPGYDFRNDVASRAENG